MTGPSSTARQSGFTLLEMLVTLLVLGMLVIGLYRGVRTGLTVWDAQSRRIAQTADLDAAARTLRLLLTEIPVKPATTGAPEPISIKGDSASLAFVGNLPNGLGATRPADITIALRDHRLILDWQPHLHVKDRQHPAEMSQTALISDVARLEFAYWGVPEAAEAPAWLGAWDRPQLPALIRVRLGFGPGDNRHWPDLIAAPRLWAPNQ